MIQILYLCHATQPIDPFSDVTALNSQPLGVSTGV